MLDEPYESVHNDFPAPGRRGREVTQASLGPPRMTIADLRRAVEPRSGEAGGPGRGDRPRLAPRAAVVTAAHRPGEGWGRGQVLLRRTGGAHRVRTARPAASRPSRGGGPRAGDPGGTAERGQDPAPGTTTATLHSSLLSSSSCGALGVTRWLPWPMKGRARPAMEAIGRRRVTRPMWRRGWLHHRFRATSTECTRALAGRRGRSEFPCGPAPLSPLWPWLAPAPFRRREAWAFVFPPGPSRWPSPGVRRRL